MSKLELVPIGQNDAFAFVDQHHRHHPSPVGYKFAIAVAQEGEIAGVIICGRPVARGLDDGWTVEVTRCCTTDGTKNAASMLYGAAQRAARALGYKRIITYTMATEKGVSLRAAGWVALYDTRARSWDMPSRPRVNKHTIAPRTLWEVELA